MASAAPLGRCRVCHTPLVWQQRLNEDGSVCLGAGNAVCPLPYSECSTRHARALLGKATP